MRETLYHIPLHNSKKKTPICQAPEHPTINNLVKSLGSGRLRKKLHHPQKWVPEGAQILRNEAYL